MRGKSVAFVSVPIAVLVFGLAAVGYNRAIAKTVRASTVAATSVKTGCRSCSQSTSTATTKWLELVAGVTYHFSDIQLSPGSNPNWQAHHGKVTSNGDYTAPSYMPESGLDDLAYTADDGSTVSVIIRIVPNPNVPASGYPRYLRRTETILEAYPSGDKIYSYNLIGGPSGATLASGKIGDLVTTDEPIAVLGPADTYEPPLDVSDCTDVPIAEATAEVISVEIPPEATAVAGVADPTDVTTLEMDAPTAMFDGLGHVKPIPRPKICKPKPVNPLPPGFNIHCNVPGGTHTVLGHYGRPEASYGPWGETVNIEVSGEFAATVLEKLGITLKVGVKYPCQRRHITWTKTRHNDVYECRNGLWTFSHTETCTSTASTEDAQPKWLIWLDGNANLNGDPAPSDWGSDSCK